MCLSGPLDRVGAFPIPLEHEFDTLVRWGLGTTRVLGRPIPAPLSYCQFAAATLTRSSATKAPQPARKANRELATVCAAVGWWRRRRWLAVNPTDGLERRRERVDRTRPSPVTSSRGVCPPESSASGADPVAAAV
jgi:hypothetical protein